MKKYISLIILGILILTSFKGWSQYSGQFYYLDNLPQSSILNPAMTPRANLYIGMPAVNNIFFTLNSNLGLNTFVQEDANGTSTYPTKSDFDFEKLYDRLSKAAYLKGDVSFTTLSFGWRSQKSYFTVSVTERIKNKFSVPSDFIKIAEKLFPAGETYDFSPLGLKTMYYREYALGYSRYLSKNLRMGTRVKYLQGIYAVSTNFDKFELKTSKESWKINVDGVVNISAPGLSINADSSLNEALNTDELDGYESSDWINFGALNFSNPGFAFDFGLHYKYNERFSFSAAITDLGFIKWGSNMNNLNLKSSFTFAGIDVSDNTIDDLTGEDSDLAKEITDSIVNSLDYRATKNSFSTAVPPVLYIGAQYFANHRTSFGLLSKTNMEKYFFDQEFTVSLNQNMWHVFTGVLNYNYSFSKGSSIGTGFALRGGPLQFYIMIDNFPLSWAFTTFKGTSETNGPFPIPYENAAVNAVFGFNFIFGANGFQNEPMIDAYSEL